MTHDEFVELVDTFGADRTRWPLLRRHRAEALLASDPALQRVLDEAAALDKILDAANPATSHEIDALLDRVVAKATAGPRLATSVPASQPASPDATRAQRAAPQARTDRRDAWRAGALMAASLAAGLYLGQAQWTASTIPLMQEMAASAFAIDGNGVPYAALTTDALDDE